MEYGRRGMVAPESVSSYSKFMYIAIMCFNIGKASIYICQQSQICLKHIYKIMLQRGPEFLGKMRSNTFCVISPLIFLFFLKVIYLERAHMHVCEWGRRGRERERERVLSRLCT